MSFVSLQFLIFFPIVVGLYFLIPHRFRWALLLFASYYFYMSWKPVYVILILLSTIVTYASGLLMARTEDKKLRKVYLFLSIVISLGILFFYKYFDFFNNTIVDLAGWIGLQWSTPQFSILLPIGISFYIFQSLSYSIDVYRGKKEPEKHFGIYALYVSFFPQLVAGPIERSTTLLPQFREKYSFDYERVVTGFQLMAWGFFKKVVVADGLALFVDRVYGNVYDFSGSTFVIISILFAFQIFADFSGYSDIAIGAARVMGFRLMKNFDRPYYAQSVQELWQRWHISLTQWFRDYVYIPLALSKRHLGRKGLVYAILITFVITGVWHGAGWTFVIFGLLHGLAVMFDVLTKKKKQALAKKIPKRLFGAVNTLYVFIFWCFSLIFFRAQNMADAWYVLRQLFTAPEHGWLLATKLVYVNMEYEFAIVLVGIAIIELVHFVERKGDIVTIVRKQKTVFRWMIYIALVVSILLFATYGATEFIYFQF